MSAARARARGFVDVFTSCLALYGMIVGTPIGGIAARLWHWTTGQRSVHRPLLSYFETETVPDKAKDQEKPHPALSFAKSALANLPPASVVAPSGIAPNLARSLALMLSNGRIAEGGHFDVELTRHARRAIERAGVRVPDKKSSTPAERERAVFEAVTKLESMLGTDEAAVAALAADFDDVRFALAMARATDAATAGRYASFRAFLPPGRRAEVDELVDGTFALASAFAIRWPLVRPGTITSRFGYRDDPLLHHQGLHAGLDISVPTGTPIVAVSEGRVLYAASDGVNGRFVKLDHGHGLTTMYCHASRLEVQKDARVKKGDVLALSGATGRSTGPHLHLQIELNHKPIDPELFLPQPR